MALREGLQNKCPDPSTVGPDGCSGYRVHPPCTHRGAVVWLRAVWCSCEPAAPTGTSRAGCQGAREEAQEECSRREVRLCAPQSSPHPTSHVDVLTTTRDVGTNNEDAYTGMRHTRQPSLEQGPCARRRAVSPGDAHGTVVARVRRRSIKDQGARRPRRRVATGPGRPPRIA